MSWPATGGYYVGTMGLLCIYNKLSFLFYFLNFNGFADLPATLFSDFGCQFGINFERVGFELYTVYQYIELYIYYIYIIYIYIYILYIYIIYIYIFIYIYIYIYIYKIIYIYNIYIYNIYI